MLRVSNQSDWNWNWNYIMFCLIYRVEKSNYFRRDGADVHTDAEISLSQAVLGGTIRVQGVYEDQNIQVSFELYSHFA